MANFTQSLTDSIRFFGPQESTRWGSPMLWGTDLWGDSTDPDFGLFTYYTTTPDIITMLPVDNYAFGVTNINNDVATFQQGAIGEFLSDGSKNYNYVFAGGSTNDENAFIPTYTVETDSAPSWSLQINSSITWTGA